MKASVVVKNGENGKMVVFGKNVVTHSFFLKTCSFDPSMVKYDRIDVSKEKKDKVVGELVVVESGAMGTFFLIFVIVIKQLRLTHFYECDTPLCFLFEIRAFTYSNYIME